MNLGKLLGAGKSFFGGRKVVSYREDKHVYLPKFNVQKNPFLPKVEEKPTAPVAAAVVPAPAPKKVSTPVVPAVTPTVVAARPVVAKMTKPAQQPAIFTAQKPLRGAGNGWMEKLNPFRAAEPAAPAQKAVQAELSLSTPKVSLSEVKVLHNDLSDADVEVVPVKSRTNAPAEAPRLTASRGSLGIFQEHQLEAV